MIPFYLDIPEINVWYPMFALEYYRAFASQYISFLERDEKLVGTPLSLEKIREYSRAKSLDVFVDDVNALLHDREAGFHDLIWKTAYSAPQRVAKVYDQRILVIIDEFQNLAHYVYRDEACQNALDETIPGSFHSLSESKIAPMLVTGSYVGWLIEISGKYLQGGRLSEWYLPPYLTSEEGLQAVYTYADVYHEPVTNDTALLMNRLCMSDPFFIACVMQSNYADRDLMTEQRENGKQMELDVVAESSCGRVVVVEVKKWKEPIGATPVEDFAEKLKVYATQFPDKTILPAFLSLGGFTENARQLCEEHGIGTAEGLAYF